MIVELLHKVAGMEMEEYTYRPRPSMAGPSRCIRQMVYQRLGVAADKELPDRLKHILNDGDWHDELTKDWIAKTTYELHSAQMGVTIPLAFDWLPRRMFPCWLCQEQICEADYHGHIDGLITDLLGVDRVYEHKGINHFSFERYASLKEFPEDYLAQEGSYLKAIQRDNPEIDEGVLILKNKNNSSFLEYLLHYDAPLDQLTVKTVTHSDGTTHHPKEVREHIVEATLAKFQQVEQYAVENRLPDRPFEYDDWHCTYCRNQETCWEGYANELQSLAGEGEIEAEWADTLRYHNELGAHIKEQEKERKEISGKIKAHLLDRKIKKARAGEYGVTLCIPDKKTIQWDEVPASLQAALDYYKTTKPVAFPKVTKLKGAVHG